MTVLFKLNKKTNLPYKRNTALLPAWETQLPRLEEALEEGNLQQVRQAVAARGERKPWRRWVAAAYYLNKDWKNTSGATGRLLMFFWKNK